MPELEVGLMDNGKVGLVARREGDRPTVAMEMTPEQARNLAGLILDAALAAERAAAA